MNGVIKAKYFKIEWLMLLSGNIHILYIVQQQWLVMLPIFAIYICYVLLLFWAKDYVTLHNTKNIIIIQSLSCWIWMGALHFHYLCVSSKISNMFAVLYAMFIFLLTTTTTITTKYVEIFEKISVIVSITQNKNCIFFLIIFYGFYATYSVINFHVNSKIKKNGRENSVECFWVFFLVEESKFWYYFFFIFMV